MALVSVATPGVAVAQANSRIEVQPATVTVGLTESFSVDIWANVPSTQSWDSAGVFLNFSTTYLQVNSITDGGSLTTILASTFDNDAGTIDYAAGSLTPVTGSLLVCTINFTSKSTNGVSTIEFVNIPPLRVTDILYAGTRLINWILVVNGTVKVGSPALTVDVSPAGKGDVKINGVTPGSYPDTTSWGWDEVVNLEALDSVMGWGFDSWSGALSGSDNPTTITMSESKSVTANFAELLPEISFSPESLTFTAVEEGSTPANETLGIWNSGVDTLHWTLSDDADWLSESPTSSSSTGADDTTSVTVSVNTTGMSDGDYAANITITAPGASNSPQTVPVTLYVGGIGPPSAAEFTITSLDVTPEQVPPGQPVTVSAEVANIGGSEGSHTVNLTVNGQVEQTKTVTLAPEATETVTFTVTKETPGSYTILIGDLTKEFTVGAPSWLSRYWWTIVVGIVAVVLLAYFLWRRRREAF